MANPVNVLLLAMEIYHRRQMKQSTENTREDYVMCDMVVKLLDEHVNSADMWLETTETLDIADCESTDGEETEESCTHEDSSSDSATYHHQLSPKATPATTITLSDKEEAVKYWLNEGGKKRLRVSTVQNRYRFVRSERELYRWKKEVAGRRKSRLEIATEINARLFEQFTDARRQSLSVSDTTLRDWALEIANAIGAKEFTASQSWISRFKRSHKIVARKITKFVSRNRSENEVTQMEMIEAFLTTAKNKIASFSESYVYNADQSGFQKEMRAKRTLSFKGEKHIEAIAQSTTALTHSYTIMPIISLDGSLLPKLYVCLQEPTGRFGPRVKQTMFYADNLVVDASKSGKMGNDNVTLFMRHAFLPFCGNKSLLLLDSWSGHKSSDSLKAVFRAHPDKEVEILQIPPGTTNVIQPLDREFFRQWKAFYRKLTEKIIVCKSLQFPVYHRDNILKLQSVVHYQFSSPRFQNVIKYAWHASKYTDIRPDSFLTPAEFCLRTSNNVCDSQGCHMSSLLVCSWCTKNLCFEHCINISHFCGNYKK